MSTITNTNATEELVWCEVGEHYVDKKDMWKDFGDCQDCTSEKDYLEKLKEEEVRANGWDCDEVPDCGVCGNKFELDGSNYNENDGEKLCDGCYEKEKKVEEVEEPYCYENTTLDTLETDKCFCSVGNCEKPTIRELELEKDYKCNDCGKWVTTDEICCSEDGAMDFYWTAHNGHVEFLYATQNEMDETDCDEWGLLHSVSGVTKLNESKTVELYD